MVLAGQGGGGVWGGGGGGGGGGVPVVMITKFLHVCSTGWCEYVCMHLGLPNIRWSFLRWTVYCTPVRLKSEK